MANLNSTFDWDAINVGDYQLDHSQNFFAAANKENNKRFSNVSDLACPTPQKISREQFDGEIKVVVPLDIGEPKEESPEKPVVKIETEPQESKPEIPADPDQEQQSDTKQIIPLSWDEDEKHMTEADQHLVHQGVRPPGVGSKLRLEWSPPRHGEHEDAGAGTKHAPKAYQFKDVYESKRQQALRRRSEEESKARQFHSRPMPNFRAMHKRMGELVVTHTITVPQTPETLKDWRGRCRVNQDQPHPAGTRPKPFNLRSEQRVRDRREFDAAVQVSLDHKKKEQDEERKRCEQEEIKEIRKMTLFKARPNPFK
ncbi:uncharacterized protein LOC108042837 [Drosophila rhopaloa]|uniref:Uncharacterized protein LOC108042837 n=1 Tax=Drosophila rhopaloa TaxID=1041015 RepID=A0A6P4EP49_DRORH|nr:uncharacterized protein LOC108042837 [Drosophila rhopaloa]